jgi:hypothetical protein
MKMEAAWPTETSTRRHDPDNRGFNNLTENFELHMSMSEILLSWRAHIFSNIYIYFQSHLFS